MRSKLKLAGSSFFAILTFGSVLQAQRVTISPGYLDLAAGSSVQYKAVVTGLTNTAVTWSVSNLNLQNGSISPSGLYRAPTTIPKNSILITAVASDHRTSNSVYVNIAPVGPTITSASPTSLPVGNYTTVVRGTFVAGTKIWAKGVAVAATSINATFILVSAYQPVAGTFAFQASSPGTLLGPPILLTFTSGAPPPPPVTQTIAPSAASLIFGGSLQFSAPGATSWRASAGSISANGLYVAPSAQAGVTTATITATGPNGSATATVTLFASPVQTIVPSAVALKLGGNQQFVSASATAWSAANGTITSAGLYTAPNSLPAGGLDTVTATGPNGSATATVTLTANQQTISPSVVSVNLSATQQFTSLNATTWTSTYGTVTSTGLYSAPASLPAGGQDTVVATGPGGSATAQITLLNPQPAQPPVITSVSNSQLPQGVCSTIVSGTGLAAQTKAQLNGVAFASTFSNNALRVTGFCGQPGPANLTVSNGGSISAPYPVQVGMANPLVTAAAARRFLEQGAFGPTPSEADHVQTVGFQPWLAEQFALPQVSNYSLITASQGLMPAHFLTMAVNNPDQLRQRVGFALGEIFVTSLQKLIWNANMIPYQNMLLADSFGNFRQIMEDVTLSPAMGRYLDMANNGKANSTINAVANENYARELMQLFTLGTDMLNPDGSVQLDANNLPVPTYSQFTITEFARVYTGWTYAPLPGAQLLWGQGTYSYTGNLVTFNSQHDFGAKLLLNGYTSPAGATPQQDLDNALDNIFNHPNVGPFFGRQLIQKLVKSNPSPAYIARVAGAFNDNGQGVRGDMQATIAAVLLDPEARANDQGGQEQATDGHFQEPALFLPGMVRAFGGQMNDQNYYPNELASLGQDLFNSPSVFNYYAPTYRLPGTSTTGGEFQIDSPNQAVIRANIVSNLFGQFSNPIQSYGPGTTVDISPFVLLGSTPAALVDALDFTLTHGTMPALMKSAIVSAVNNDTRGDLHRAETACYLILSSSFYNVWH